MKKKEKQMTLKISIVVISMLIPSMGMSQSKTDSVQHLKEVTVTGVRPLIKADLDKFTYNVAYDPDSKSQSILEILRKVPMVNVEGTDQIKVNGSTDFKVYVNGKPNTMMSNMMIAKMPSSISKAVLFSNLESISFIFLIFDCTSFKS